MVGVAVEDDVDGARRHDFLQDGPRNVDLAKLFSCR
jgi:hypothetical protein